MKQNRSHGSGQFERSQLRLCPENVILEDGVLIFHPDNVSLHSNVYIGHNTILKGYWKNEMIIGESTWIGQSCFFHSAGGLFIGRNVGIGPCVKIITSSHREAGVDIPILDSPVDFAPVRIEDDCDLGVGVIVLPGVTLGRGCQIGAGAVVTRSLPPCSVAAGVPARILRSRTDSPAELPGNMEEP